MTAVMVAIKFLEDFFYKNEYYAKIGGIPKVEMNVLEHDFLKAINFNLNVSEREFNVYIEKLISYRDSNFFL